MARPCWSSTTWANQILSRLLRYTRVESHKGRANCLITALSLALQSRVL
jgi:hypothetical protein